jgi:DNA-binding transcriptional MerR regulator
MEYRVEQLAARAGVSVDTVRFYQARGVLQPPRRQGRVAWYSDDHLARIERVRALQAEGLTLAAIRRVLAGELDQADQALVVALARGAGERTGATDGPEDFLTLDELAERTGVPRALLVAVEREGLLQPRRLDGEPRYTQADVEMVSAGLRLLEHGLPLAELLDLARRHHDAMRAVAEQAVAVFDDHVRQPLRQAGGSGEEAAAKLVEAFIALLPATTTLVANHFRRTLLAVAQEHIEKVGDRAEVEATRAEATRRLEVAWPA